MKRSLFLFTGLVPRFAVATSTGMLLAGLGNIPDDFKSYFFQSEMPVQVYLNDNVLFEASMRMREDGGVTLVSIISSEDETSPEIQQRWEAILRKGIETGRCEKTCPDGLISADYSLNNSTLRLLTSRYEKERVQGDYIDLPDSFPAGLIIDNDFSAIQSSSADKRWSLNSKWTASLGGWSHNMSFQSTRVVGQYSYDTTDLYDLYSQKELAGNFLRVGFFTPDNDSGNVQTSNVGYNSVIGVMWGTSDILLNSSDSVSAWPVYVTGRNQAVAEVWRDGRLIHTQQLQDGIQALDTRRLPGGAYDITIRILENGQVVDTQTAQIYKPNSWRNTSRHWRANLWAGQQQDISSSKMHYAQDQNKALGGSLDVLAWSGGILGASATVLENDDYWLRFRSDITLSSSDSIFVQHTRTSSGLTANKGTDARYYRNLSSGTSGSLYWRNTRTDFSAHQQNEKRKSDTWGSSITTRMANGASITGSLEHQDSPWRRGLNADASITTRHNWFKRDTDVRISGYDRAGYQGGSRDRGAAINLTMSLFPNNNHHSVSAGVGVNDGQTYSNASYQWSPENESYLSWLGAGVSRSGNMTTVSGNGAVNTRYLNGDGFVQHTTSVDNTTAGLNLHQTLAVGGGKIATTQPLHGHDSVMIVDVEDESGAGIIASGARADQKLKPGRNVVPVNLWQRDSLQFNGADNSAKVTPERVTMQMNRGSVGYIKVQSTKTRTVIAVLRDSQGNILPGSTVTAGTEKGFAGEDGILTMDIAHVVNRLKVYHDASQRKLHCDIPSFKTHDENVQFINEVICK